MPAGSRPWARRRVPRLLWWLWPALPTSWSDVPGRLRPEALQVGRLTVAAVLSYLVANWVSPGILDLTAPLTALLVVQASTVGTLQMGLVRVGAVLTGVLVAVAFATFAGLSWWSLGAVIAASLILAKVLRLGEQSLETPISAMLILAVSGHGLAAEVRLVNTLIGTVVGIAFSLLLPVAISNQGATDAVRRVARHQAGLLDEVAVTLGARAPQDEEVAAWLAWADQIQDEVDEAEDAVRALERSRRLNAFALTAAKVHPGLLTTLERLDRCLVAERALLVVIGEEAALGEASDDAAAGELQGAFAVVLDDLADGLRAFGDLVDAEYGAGASGSADPALARTLDSVQETRAMLTELMLLVADPREDRRLWMLQGSVLAAVDQVLQQLDPARTERSEEPWLRRRMPALASPWRWPRRRAEAGREH